MDEFKALVLNRHEGHIEATICQLSKTALPEGDVLVSIAFSSLNYKDGLALSGTGSIVRSYPMVPGVDFAGTVIESLSPDFHPGDEVILTGWGVGERHWGGYAQLARVKSEWLVPLPKGLSLQQAMGIGSAGFTAMMSVLALEEHGAHPEGKGIVVTGAAGGVGSCSVAILSRLGYHVVASTRRKKAHEYLRELGASVILPCDVLAPENPKPLDTQKWAGAIDSVGGSTLAGLLPCIAYGGSVAACGLAGGNAFTTTVFPFILRGVNLLGIESVMCPQPRRRMIWERLSHDMPLDMLKKMMQVVSLEDLPAFGQDILQGNVRGRVVVDVR